MYGGFIVHHQNMCGLPEKGSYGPVNFVGYLNDDVTLNINGKDA